MERRNGKNNLTCYLLQAFSNQCLLGPDDSSTVALASCAVVIKSKRKDETCPGHRATEKQLIVS